MTFVFASFLSLELWGKMIKNTCCGRPVQVFTCINRNVHNHDESDIIRILIIRFKDQINESWHDG